MMIDIQLSNQIPQSKTTSTIQQHLQGIKDFLSLKPFACLFEIQPQTAQLPMEPLHNQLQS